MAKLIPINGREINYLVTKEWIPKVLPNQLLKSFLGFLPFFLLCLLLYKICKTKTHLKIVLTIIFLAYSYHLYSNIEFHKFYSKTEQFILQFISFCMPPILCVWFFKIQDQSLMTQRNESLDSPINL